MEVLKSSLRGSIFVVIVLQTLYLKLFQRCISRYVILCSSIDLTKLKGGNSMELQMVRESRSTYRLIGFLFSFPEREGVFVQSKKF